MILERILLLLLVGDLRMVQQESLKQEMLDLEHVHLRSTPGQLRPARFLALSNPILGRSIEEDAGLREGKAQLPRVLFPKDELINEVKIGLFVVVRMIVLRLSIRVSISGDEAVIADAHPLADGTAASLEV
jgi:hypothetical protein